MEETSHRFLQKWLSPAATNNGKVDYGGLGKAESISISHNGEDDSDDGFDNEEHVLEVDMSFGEDCWDSVRIPLHHVDSEGEFTRDSESFIIDALCPLMERLATQVRSLYLALFGPRVVGALLNCFHRNRLTQLD
jgi:hypothetical protein